MRKLVCCVQVQGMLTDFGEDMHCQFLEILRTLLDAYSSGSQVHMYFLLKCVDFHLAL